MSLSELPGELLLLITEALKAYRDINAFARTSRRFYHCLNPHLYRYDLAKFPSAWIADMERDRELSRATFEHFLRAGADPNARDTIGRLGRPALHVAVRYRGEWMVSLLLEAGADPRAQDNIARTALHIAAEHCTQAVVLLLLRQPGVDADATDQDGRTPLFRAAMKGNQAVIELLLGSSTMPDGEDTGGMAPLAMAAAKGHLRVVRQFLDDPRIDPNRENSFTHRTPLMVAAEHGREAVFNVLFDDQRVRAEHTDGVGRTALWFAAVKGHADIVRFLLHDGRLHPDHKSDDCETPLWFAARRGHAVVVKLLLDDSRVDAHRGPYLSLAAERGHSVVVELLLAAGVDPNREHDGLTPLMDAVLQAHEAVVRILLGSRHVDPNTQGRSSGTALCRAVYYRNEPIIKLILERDDVDPNLAGSKGRSAVFIAVERNSLKAMKLLIADSRVNPNKKDDQHRTPLGMAALKGRTSMVRLLTAYDHVRLEEKDVEGRTALSWAIGKGHLPVTKQLLRDGADPNIRDDKGRSPLWWAAFNGDRAMLELLTAIDQLVVDTPDKFRMTPLSVAARKGHEAAVKLLLEKGARPDFKDHKGHTPSWWASHKGHNAVFEQICAWIRDHPASNPANVQRLVDMIKCMRRRTNLPRTNRVVSKTKDVRITRNRRKEDVPSLDEPFSLNVLFGDETA